MAYSKLQKVIQDFALGYQTVNQASDNIDAVRTDYFVKHGSQTIPSLGDPTKPSINFGSGPNGGLTSQPQAGSQPWLKYGRHNDPLNPRGVVYINVFLITLGSTSTSLPSLNLTVSSDWIGVPTRLSQGQYFFPLFGMGQYGFGHPQPYAASSATAARIAQARYFAPGDPTYATGLYVSLYELDAGAWTPTDYSFSIPIWGAQT